MNLQEHIRRVLREDKKSKFIMDIVDKHGVYKTAKMMGVSLTYLYKMSDLKIDEFVAKELLAENIVNGNLPAKYKGFEIEISSDDVFYWTRQFKSGHYEPNVLEKIWVMATPFFATADYTPVEVDWYVLEDDSPKPNVGIYDTSGDGDYFVELTHNTHNGNYFFNSVDNLFDWYNTFYLPEVYEIILDRIIPQVQEETDERLRDKNT